MCFYVASLLYISTLEIFFHYQYYCWKVSAFSLIINLLQMICFFSLAVFNRILLSLVLLKWSRSAIFKNVFMFYILCCTYGLHYSLILNKSQLLPLFYNSPIIF